MIIYLATNKVNGKKYVGLTKGQLTKRVKAHLGRAFVIDDHNYYCVFHRAIRKYGKKSFEWCIIDSSAKTYKELQNLEKKYIALYETYMYIYPDKGYNMTLGGEGSLGYKHDDETRKRMSDNHTSIGHTGFKHSDESKKIMSIKRTGVAPYNKGMKMPERCGENHPNYNKQITSNRGANNYKSKKIKDITTCKTYNCIRECAEDLGIKYKNLRNGMRVNLPKYTSRFEYV